MTTRSRPTFLKASAAGAAAMALAADGVSFAPLLRGQEVLPERPLFWHYPHYHQTTPAGAVRLGRWKLIKYFEDGRTELYDLAEDVGETTDLAAARPEVGQDLLGPLRAWRDAVGAQMPRPNPDYQPKGA